MVFRTLAFWLDLKGEAFPLCNLPELCGAGSDDFDQGSQLRRLYRSRCCSSPHKQVGKYPMELKNDGKDCLKFQHMELRDFNSLVYWSRYVYGRDGSSLLEDMYARRRMVAEAEQSALERAAKLPAMKVGAFGRRRYRYWERAGGKGSSLRGSGCFRETWKGSRGSGYILRFL